MADDTIDTSNATDVVPTPTDIVSRALTTKPLESKKWIAMIVGVSCVIFVWACSVICMLIKSSIASEFVSIATIVISFIGAMVTLLITGQAAMEWKATSALSEMNNNTNSNTLSNTLATNTTVTRTENPDPKPFSQPAQQ